MYPISKYWHKQFLCLYINTNNLFSYVNLMLNKIKPHDIILTMLFQIVNLYYFNLAPCLGPVNCSSFKHKAYESWVSIKSG